MRKSCLSNIKVLVFTMISSSLHLMSTLELQKSSHTESVRQWENPHEWRDQPSLYFHRLIHCTIHCMTGYSPQIYKVMWNGNKKVQGTYPLPPKSGHIKTRNFLTQAQLLKKQHLKEVHCHLVPPTVSPCFPCTQHVLHLGENHWRDLLWCHNLVLSLHLRFLFLLGSHQFTNKNPWGIAQKHR